MSAGVTSACGGVESSRLSAGLVASSPVMKYEETKRKGLVNIAGVTSTCGGVESSRLLAEVVTSSPLIKYKKAKKKRLTNFAGVTQLVESQPSKLLVAGSSPVSRSKDLNYAVFILNKKDAVVGRIIPHFSGSGRGSPPEADVSRS